VAQLQHGWRGNVRPGLHIARGTLWWLNRMLAGCAEGQYSVKLAWLRMWLMKRLPQLLTC
jgi:hypothetical protein